jgi:hypothetical protein
MTMQYDVKSAHLNVSGMMVVGRVRLKGFVSMGTATAGTINFWDTTTAPVSATYGRSGTTVTVTRVAHGLNTGDLIGLTFALDGSSRAATNGNYTVTRLTADTYTITDINSGTVTAGTAAGQGTRLMASIDTNTASDVTTLLVPGEGVLALNGIYAQLASQTGLTIFYG